MIFIGFHRFLCMGSYNGKEGLAAPIETFARFQAGFLSSEDFHRFLLIFIDLYDFHRFSEILLDFRDFGAWVLARP